MPKVEIDGLFTSAFVLIIMSNGGRRHGRRPARWRRSGSVAGNRHCSRAWQRSRPNRDGFGRPLTFELVREPAFYEYWAAMTAAVARGYELGEPTRYEPTDEPADEVASIVTDRDSTGAVKLGISKCSTCSSAAPTEKRTENIVAPATFLQPICQLPLST